MMFDWINNLTFDEGWLHSRKLLMYQRYKKLVDELEKHPNWHENPDIRILENGNF